MNLICKLFGHQYTVLVGITTVSPTDDPTDFPAEVLLQTTLYDYSCRRCGDRLPIDHKDEHIEKEIHRLQTEN